MDAGGEYSAEGLRHVVERCGVSLDPNFRLHPDPLTPTPKFENRCKCRFGEAKVVKNVRESDWGLAPGSNN